MTLFLGYMWSMCLLPFCFVRFTSYDFSSDLFSCNEFMLIQYLHLYSWVPHFEFVQGSLYQLFDPPCHVNPLMDSGHGNEIWLWWCVDSILDFQFDGLVHVYLPLPQQELFTCASLIWYEPAPHYCHAFWSHCHTSDSYIHIHISLSWCSLPWSPFHIYTYQCIWLPRIYIYIYMDELITMPLLPSFWSYMYINQFSAIVLIIYMYDQFVVFVLITYICTHEFVVTLLIIYVYEPICSHCLDYIYIYYESVCCHLFLSCMYLYPWLSLLLLLCLYI